MENTTTPDYTKYIDSLKLVGMVAEAGVGEKNVTAEWDVLYNYVHANFAPPVKEKFDIEVESLAEMFSLSFDELKVRLHEIPPTILEECFPVWAGRYLLMSSGPLRCNIEPHKSRTFNEFHKRYGSRIIQSCDLRWKRKVA